MNFLNSAFLAGLAAALIPLLIHLLNRRRLKTVDFSSVMFLRDLRKTRMRRVQLRRWLLLLIRTLLIATIVMAFARPALKGGLFAALGSRARTTAVIAVDRSASMALETQNGSAYQRALTRVGDIAGIWGEGDEAIALPFSAPVPPETEPATADIAALVEDLREIPISSGATDAGAAINTALAAVATSANLNREIYLFSDFQREGFTGTSITPPATGAEEITLYLIDVAEPGGFDLSVNSVELTNRMIEPGSPFAISSTVANHTARPVDRLLVSLFVDGRRVAQRESAVAANGLATVSFSAVVEDPGVHRGFVEISSDDNALNNQRFFTLTIPDKTRVLLASDYPSARIAAALALRPQNTENSRVEIEQVDTDALIRQNLFDYDCVVITEWRQPRVEIVQHLLRYIRAGGGVFVAPSFDADTTAWNTLLAGPHFDLRVGPQPAPPEPDRYFVWDRFDWDHPIWSIYEGVDPDRIPEIRWHAIFRTQGSHSGDAVVGYSGGRPSLSEVHLDAGKLIVLWSAMNPPFTDLSLRSIFVPFTHRLVEYLAADLSERRSDFLVGRQVTREPAVSLPPESTVEVIGPSGARLRPGLERDGSQVRITLDAPEETGVYTIALAGRTETPIDAFSVNTDPREAEPDVISRDELSRRWPGLRLVFVEPGQPLAEVITQTRYGTEIRPAFLWIVAALFFLEMLVARARRRDLPPTGATTQRVAHPAVLPAD